MHAEPIFYKHLIRTSNWCTDTRFTPVPDTWASWLLDRGSLTSALTQWSGGEFRVRVLSERWCKPLSREARQLNLSSHLATRIREVELLCYGKVVVYARSVIPLALYQRERHTFDAMGSKPLGHLLFQNGRPRFRQRSLSEFKRDDDVPVYGRATPYEYHGSEILVSEFFVNPDLIAESMAR